MYFPRPPVWYPRDGTPVSTARPRAIWEDHSCDTSDCSEGGRQMVSCPSCNRGVEIYTDGDIVRKSPDGSGEEPNPSTGDLIREATAAAASARVDAGSGVDDTHSEGPSFVNALNSKFNVSKETSDGQYMTEKYNSASDDDGQQSSEENLSNKPRGPFRQTKPGLCTRLQLYKDVRLERGEKWAIQEGALVVCIDPSYTRLDRNQGFPDEFELTTGDFYIVCRLYADLWALCIKVSFDSRGGSCSHDTMGGCGFLPLCAVTLAANFSGFVKRCFRYASCPRSETMYPGNGLQVIPPERSHSVNASKQVFQGDTTCVYLPDIIQGACGNLSLEGIETDFIPLDSTLQQLFSKFGSWKGRAHRLRSRMSLHNLWRGLRSDESGTSSPITLTSKSTLSSVHARGSGSRSEYQYHFRRSSSSSQGWQWQMGVV